MKRKKINDTHSHPSSIFKTSSCRTSLMSGELSFFVEEIRRAMLKLIKNLQSIFSLALEAPEFHEI